MNRVAGKVVVVTGAAQGQGAAEAAALTREGAAVIATDFAEAPPGGLPDGAVDRRLDVTSEPDWADLAAWLRRPPLSCGVSALKPRF
ncbi:hypothetical protein [Actinomadura violacea]|uniref:Uncharacterized protein n=1 Tax=Actinomadura violacea TaxID=2819934 RepID=A0ABS3RQW7_9ACTN|nr:hypothetical protein [Actinomadura violacea]MBO2458454.1 hypothetical protein [Actinomadura violacea]